VWHQGYAWRAGYGRMYRHTGLPEDRIHALSLGGST
jgi:hypothetical protein